MLDRELALRFFAFRLLSVDDTFKTLSFFLDRAMEKIDEEETMSNELQQLSEEFIESLKFSELILGENHKFSRAMAVEGAKSLNRSLFDVITVSFSKIKDKKRFLKHAHIFRQELISLISDEQSAFSQAIFQGTSSKRAVLARFSEMEKLINKIEKLK